MKNHPPPCKELNMEFIFKLIWNVRTVTYISVTGNSTFQPERHVVPCAEMPTLNGDLKEYECHFSGIWGHFPECCIFRHKSTKCTHTSLL